MCIVSVVLMTYNSEAFLTETLNSIFSQTLKDIEVIVMDDNSTDNTLKLLASYSDPRLHYFVCQHRRIYNLNWGMSLAKGKYIARMDHDDIMLPERLERQYYFMEEHPEIAVCGSWMQTFGKEELLIRCIETNAEISAAMVMINPMANPTTFIRKDVLHKNRIVYREGFSFAEDYQMWAEIILVGRFANLQEVLLKYRGSDGQTTNKKIDEIMEASERIKIRLIEEYYSRLKPNIGRYRLRQFECCRESFLRKEMNPENYFRESYFFFQGIIAADLITFNYD